MSSAVENSSADDRIRDQVLVTLCTGEQLDISRFDACRLQQLQWQQERAFSALIAGSKRGSPRRAELFRQAYDTVTTILGRMTCGSGDALVMGYNRRYAALVLKLLARHTRANDRPPRVFEIGYGSGALLSALPGVQVSGIEVSTAMREQACQYLSAECHDHLYLGDFLTHDLSAVAGCDLVFWNDVLEHLVPDEVTDFFRRAYELLVPGGYLVTITPNWHMRPSDITRAYHPPRTTAVGFHLKEYTLREVSRLLRQAGFVQGATPLFVTRHRMFLAGSGLAGVKRAAEPFLEWLPFAAARLLCRGMGLSCTVARRP